MKFILAHLLLFAACHAEKISNETPMYIATVQEKMPGNLMVDDSPNSNPRHFTRQVFVLLENNMLPKIDSILYHNQTVNYTIEQVEDGKKEFSIGSTMLENKPIFLEKVPGKKWWHILLSDDNDSFYKTATLVNPLLIYVQVNDKKATWAITKESIIAPQETY